MRIFFIFWEVYVSSLFLIDKHIFFFIAGVLDILIFFMGMCGIYLSLHNLVCNSFI